MVNPFICIPRFWRLSASKFSENIISQALAIRSTQPRVRCTQLNAARGIPKLQMMLHPVRILTPAHESSLSNPPSTPYRIGTVPLVRMNGY
ncbi:MAG: hypothetical protein CM1200mP18_02090 [Gammaproteobacteria bacterium]|nr:MAG: hypothetical protein CM1200mP18_02090 [Gammaproteobacteria bacterium]